MQVQYVYHCCLCLIFDQITMAQEQKYFQTLLFLGHAHSSSNKKQTAVMNILNLHIFHTYLICLLAGRMITKQSLTLEGRARTLPADRQPQISKKNYVLTWFTMKYHYKQGVFFSYKSIEAKPFAII